MTEDGSAGFEYGLPSEAGGGAPPPAFWAQDRAQVFEILSAYVRTNSHRPPVGPADGSAATLQVRQADVSAAITVLARRTVLDGDSPLDLSGSVLPGARLGWARLAQADLRGADLRGAHLTGARVSAETGWPPGFDWRAAGARLVRAC